MFGLVDLPAIELLLLDDLLAIELLLHLELDRLVLVATSPHDLPGPEDRASSREEAAGHFSWDNLTLQLLRGEEEEMLLLVVEVGELAITTSSAELPTGTRPKERKMSVFRIFPNLTFINEGNDSVNHYNVDKRCQYNDY